MKTILIDALYTFIDTHGEVDTKIFELLEEYDTHKIICTNASVEKIREYNLDIMKYPVFTLSRDPAKTDPEYFHMLMQEFSLFPSECIYIEHNHDAVVSAQSIGITSYHFDAGERDMSLLHEFIKNNIR
jgi:FMN phosphatase YigB (HAD superfamily)